MLEKIRSIIFQILRIKTPPVSDAPDRYVRDYEMTDGENITAAIANKLGMLTFADSTCTIKDVGKRSALMSEVIGNLFDKGAGIAAQAFGKGGKVFVPFVHDGHIDVQAISQNRMLIHRMDGNKIMCVSLLLDTCVIDTESYWLIVNYDVASDGVQTIRYRACTYHGSETPLERIPKWENVQPEISIANTDRALLGFLRCPVDNRKDIHSMGVPITYGAQKSIKELIEHIAIYRREYKLSRMMLGLDASLWRDFGRGKLDADGVTIDDVKRTAQDSDNPFVPVEGVALDSKTPWQQYAPNIRFEAMEARYNSLLRRVEKDCGLSQGILTERKQVNYANRDEVRAAQYDTFAVIRAMRTAWERAVDDLAYAVDVLAEFYGLTPGGSRGQYEIEYDWDMSMIESTEQTFTQYMELQSVNAMSRAEVRAWVTGESLEDAQKAVEDAQKAGQDEQGGSALDRLINRMSGNDES